jgi:hypothetical protein
LVLYNILVQRHVRNPHHLRQGAQRTGTQLSGSYENGSWWSVSEL